MANDLFGEQDITNSELELADDWYDVQAVEPSMPQGKMLFTVDHYEPHPATKPGSNAFGYYFYFKPYQNADGSDVSLAASSKLVSKYFFIGRVVDGQLQDAPGTGFAKTFFASIGLGRGKVKLSQEAVKGAVVTGNVVWKKQKSNNPDPTTGKIPEAIDDNNAYTFYYVVELADGSVSGVRNPDGEVQKVVSI